MSLEALLASLESQCVTPVTLIADRGVTSKPASVLDCTPETRVTPQGGETASDVQAQRWVIHFADRDPLEVTFAPAVTHAEALASYRCGVAAEPIPESPGVMIPPDLTEAFDQCAAADRYGDRDRTSLSATFAVDPVATRALATEMRGRTGQCRRCEHFSRPGLSDGYCTGRDDLPLAYGLLRVLPADAGAWCPRFARGRASDRVQAGTA